jgi:hypothetical protein
MAAVRAGHTATLLRSGQVLVAGGEDGDRANYFPSSAELYLPAGGTFFPAGNLATPRPRFAATLLLDEGVLIVGGNPWSVSAELYK